jgi:hypothetical protein
MELLAQELSVRVEELWENDGAVAPIPINAAEKEIILEYSKGTDRLKLVLPPTPQSYALIADEISDWKRPLDPNLSQIVDCWKDADNEAKKRIMEICEQIKPTIQA